MRKTMFAATIGTVAVLTVAGCSSSSDNSSSGGDNSPIKIGVLTSLTGPAASGFTTAEAGVKARVDLANESGGINGHKIEYVMEDDQSSVAGAATAVKKAIQQDKVFGLISISSTFYGAYKETLPQKVPVVGAGFDGGPEWLDKDNTNLFDALGGMDYTKVATTMGDAAKKLGVKKMASVGYIESPSAAEAAKASIESAGHAGLEKGPYQGVHFGSTDVGPTVLAIKESGADGLYLPVIPNTAFAILAGLKQAGVDMKMTALATGYGGDLLGSPEATAAGEGAYFLSTLTPAEANTDGTKKLQAALKKSSNYDGIPTFAQYAGWATADAFLFGLSKAGNNPSADSFNTNLRKNSWDNAGLGKPVDFSKVGVIAGGVGADNCTNFTQMKGGKFVLPEGLDPICGTIIDGVTVSP